MSVFPQLAISLPPTKEPVCDWSVYNIIVIGFGYCIHTLTRHSWIHYTDCWIVK